MELGRKESDIEGVAIHGGPESCVGVREGVGEALTGVSAGWAIEPRNPWSRGADAVVKGGRQHRRQRYRELLSGPARSVNPGMRGNSIRENGEIPRSPAPVDHRPGPRGERQGGNPSMNEHGKSDGLVVPAKPPNKAGLPGAEAVEGRGPAEGNAASKTRSGHRAGPGAPSALGRVRRKAQLEKEARFTALLHHVDVDLLRAAYRALNPRAATGVDGVTWQAYGRDLEANLRDLHDRVHRGQLSGEADAEGVHPESGRPAAAVRDRRVGGQDPATRRRRGAQRHLRDGLPRFLLRVPARTRPARCVGRAGVRDLPEGELGARRGHPRLLRQRRSRLADEVPRAPHRRSRGSCG